ncbi:fatty acid desaturase family protein [Hydrocarboniclastica marina]|uniref:Acyl-CoA desaturase n=1 Tax=Hydrocarboniclastica marina TaxID=2259620 RepID=A0A4P7XDJ5_9ALTE|nr:acyl-CoA desaturase [Hydrocarboniclastica marina]MAL98713.1 acyl-CoA desaturase [Alteromonadaceae bacterium]QCF24603.1 acyl-CoA desaturase [Hydrocarboniclastica marina]|tara:strand:+ start:409 stop:1509 length:1101 start_codon:yes stop_codon:yes gene_type:complete
MNRRPDAAAIEAFGGELEALRRETLAQVGQRDADYIRRTVRRQRYAELLGRGLLLLGFHPLAWLVGVIMLSVSKILNNMEIGHNVMHGQYDFMNDPDLQSQTYNWDSICCPDSWRKTHNYEHHTYTNVLGLDRDFGYGAYRMSEEMEWEPKHRYQLFYYGLMSLLFQWGVGLHDLEAEHIRSGKITRESKLPVWRAFLQRMRRHLAKDYVLFPLLGMLTGAGFVMVALGNFVANTVRNVWASSVIFCGHFTEDVHTFAEEDCRNETRGQWYYRQTLGSSNFHGGRLMHIMSGHLSLQIEHHLFPDIPAHRYPELAPRVEEICRRYGVPYNTGSFLRQFSASIARLIRFSRPPRSEDESSAIQSSSS